MRKSPHVKNSHLESASILLSNVGAIIKTLRVTRDLSLRELSEATGIDHSYIYRVERGIIECPDPEKLALIITSLTVGPWLYK